MRVIPGHLQMSTLRVKTGAKRCSRVSMPRPRTLAMVQEWPYLLALLSARTAELEVGGDPDGFMADLTPSIGPSIEGGENGQERDEELLNRLDVESGISVAARSRRRKCLPNDQSMPLQSRLP
jgi:hypothetical protein